MTHKEKNFDEWLVDICDECGHEVDQHYDKPYTVIGNDGAVMYTAFGCMAIVPKIRGGRVLDHNPHPRCKCLHSV